MTDPTQTAAAPAPTVIDTELKALIRIGDAITRTGDAMYGMKNAMLANTTALSKLGAALAGAAGTGAVTVQTPGSGGDTGAAPAPAQTPAAPIATGQASMAVGPTRTIKEPADALPYLADGAIITLDDGVYLKPFHNTVRGLAIVSTSGMPRRCVMDGQGGHGGGHTMAWQKAFIHSSVPIVVHRVGFVRCGSTGSTEIYSNEAAIWLGDTNDGSGSQPPKPTTEPWAVQIVECTFDDCANGIFTAAEPALTLVQTGSIFGGVKPNGMNAAAAGLGTHAAHDIYSSAGANDISASYFFGGPGHSVKTRSDKTNVHDNPLMCQDGGRVLDACEGGTVLFTGNTVFTRLDRQGQAIGQNTGAYGNSNLLEYAGENANHGTPGALMSNNRFHITRSGSTIATGNGGSITSASDVAYTYGAGSLNIQGAITGGPLVQPMVGVPPPMPAVPDWAGA